MMWSTGQVGNTQRALLREGKVVAVFDDVETCAVVVRRLSEKAVSMHELRGFLSMLRIADNPERATIEQLQEWINR